MKYKEILKILEKDYGWETTRYFKKNTQELIVDVAKIVTDQNTIDLSNIDYHEDITFEQWAKIIDEAGYKVIKE